jgi:hypothetical protein
MFKYVTSHKKKLQNNSFIYSNHVIIIQGENGYTRKEEEGKGESEIYGTECGKRGRIEREKIITSIRNQCYTRKTKIRKLQTFLQCN